MFSIFKNTVLIACLALALGPDAHAKAAAKKAGKRGVASESNVIVLASIKVKPESVEAFRAKAEVLPGAVRQEKGCLAYSFLQLATDPTSFATSEEWATAEDFDTHMKTQGMQNFLKDVGDMLAGPPDIKMFKRIGAVSGAY